MLLAWCWLALGALGCAAAQKDPCTPRDLNGCIVDELEVIDNQALSKAEIEEKIATGETGGVLENVPILGAFDALSADDVRFDRFVLERDLSRIERLYRARGYYEAHVTAGRARRMSKVPLLEDEPPPARQSKERRDALLREEAKHTRVRVEVVVDEGPPTVLEKVDLVWRDWSSSTDPDAVKGVTNAKNQLKTGEPFDEEKYEATRKAIQKAMTDAGYAYAKAEKSADVDVQHRKARVSYAIELGPKCKFGKISIVGLGQIPEWQIRPALGFAQGDAFSTAKLEAAEVALTDFNVFATINMEPDLPKDGARPSDVPIRVVVEPAKLGVVKLGGGIEAGDQVATRGIVGWQIKNLFRILDSFNVEARPRLVFYPWKLSTLFSQAPYRVVPEITLRAQYAFPFPFEPRTTVFAQAEASIARPKNAETPENAPRDYNVLGYQEVAGRWGVQRKFFLSRFLVSPTFNMTYANPFSYNLDKPPEGLLPLSIRYLELFLEVDLRRGNGKWDPIAPRSGAYIATDVQLGGYFLGGNASDVKVKPELRVFVPLSKKVVLAGRIGTGLLFTHSYGTTLDKEVRTADIENGCQPPAAPCPKLDPAKDIARREIARDLQVLQLRGLYSGGPSSNRGYGFNEISPHRVLDDNGQRLGSAASTGGRTSWEASVELRFPIAGSLGGSWFVDASDVTAGFAEYRIDHPHISTGVGVRYETPVGPFRVDLGYRIPGLQVLGKRDVATCIKLGTACDTLIVDEGDPSELFGLPLALAIAIGNAF
jgi:outer membrane protein insertion porin family/translocation and assembly module TamA